MDHNWGNRWKVKQHRHMCLILIPLWLLATLDLASAGNKARGIDPRGAFSILLLVLVCSL